MSAWETTGQSDEWRTPKYVFDAMRTPFDMDVAAAERNDHVPAEYVIRRAEDGLRADWHGFVWMNPPFGGRNGIRPWLEKFRAHDDGVCLTPDRTSAPWWQWAANQMSYILFVSPKIKFVRPDGSLGKSPGCGTCLMSRGNNGYNALVNAKNSGLGVLVRSQWA